MIINFNVILSTIMWLKYKQNMYVYFIILIMGEKHVEMSVKNSKEFGRMPIKMFSFDAFRKTPSPAIAMVAKRGSGKSWIVREIMDYFRDIPVGLIISPSDRLDPFYAKFFPDAYIHYEYKTETIEKVFMRQKKIKKKADLKLKENKKIDTRCFIIMDDCLASKGSWIRDAALRDIFFNGRHSDIMYILTMQFPLGITPELRSNFDYVFILAEDTISNLKRIYDHYAGVFPTFDSFRQVFSQLTEDHGSMVIANRGARAHLSDKIFWFKARNLDNMSCKFGCDQFRAFNAANYNKKWDNEDEWSENDFFSKKKQNKERIIIDKIQNSSKYEKGRK